MRIVNRRFVTKSNNKYFDLLKFKNVNIKINLLIIGAQKSATTSLHNLLNKHNSICMSFPIKEPGYFIPFRIMQTYFKNKNVEIHNSKTLFDKYIISKYNGEKILGEASTYYSSYDINFQNFVETVNNYNKKMKFIYLIRKPIDRIISHFFHEKAKKSNLEINEFIATNKNVLQICDYKKVCQNYSKNFAQDNFHLIIYQNLINNTKEELNRITRFLNISGFQNTILPKLNKSTSAKDYSVVLKSISDQNLERINNLTKQQIEFFKTEHNLKLDNWLVNF